MLTSSALSLGPQPEKTFFFKDLCDHIGSPTFLSPMVQNNLPIFTSTDCQLQILTTFGKSFLPCNVIYVQTLEMRMWISLGALLSTTTTQIAFASKQNQNLLCPGQALCTQEWLPLLDQAWNLFLFWFLSLTHYRARNSDFLFITLAPIWELDSCPQAGGVLQLYSTPGTSSSHPQKYPLSWQIYPLCPGLPPEAGTSNRHNQTSASILSPLWPPRRLFLATAGGRSAWKIMGYKVVGHLYKA